MGKTDVWVTTVTLRIESEVAPTALYPGSVMRVLRPNHDGTESMLELVDEGPGSDLLACIRVLDILER